MTRDEVLEKVKQCIVESVGVKYEEIHLHSQVVNDLGADSLDLVALIYQLETEFDISLQRGAIMERITVLMQGTEFLDDAGMVTESLIRQELLELKNVEFAAAMTLQSLITYFTVEIFVNLIMRALDKPE